MFTRQITDPVVDFSRLNPEIRRPGLAGFMRLRNEGEYLAQSIESWLPVLDELIIVYNNCQDNTADIVEEYASRYPDKIKAFHYIPIVYPPGSEGFIQAEANSYHSLMNYYNFALTHTSTSWVVKIDGDLIIPDKATQELVRAKYYELQDGNNDWVQPLSGVNLIRQGKGGVIGGYYCPSSSVFCGLYGDLGIFYVDETTYYIRAKNGAVESLQLNHHTILPIIYAYYHLKFARRDFGIANYELGNNKNSVYLSKTWVFLWHLKLIKLEEILASINQALPMPPKENDWDMPIPTDYRKEAIQYFWNSYQSLGSIKLLLIEEWGYWCNRYRLFRGINKVFLKLMSIIR